MKAESERETSLPTVVGFGRKHTPSPPTQRVTITHPQRGSETPQLPELKGS